MALLECYRNDEFAPIKNKEGDIIDSPNTARKLVSELNIKYLEKLGI